MTGKSVTRIVQKMFCEKSTLLLTSNLFLRKLPLFKSFALIFKLEELQIFWQHKMIVENFRAFLACFMKFEVLNDGSSES